ncbi:MAG: asparagine synthase-related protein [Actinomycetota bacterium]|nr:asparagine synthase-related protein [Actinomycetota bacterium]
MCGIALILGDGARRDRFERMLEAIRPRGDVEETLTDEGMLLGTQRLKIVDREHAVQPWCSEDGRWALCYNGEVFNHDELRAELHRLGHRFRTRGDTEVVLEAFLEWGEGAVDRLRGEFAFAVVDRRERRAYLVRDPVGVRPLHWATADGCLHVASEVKALVPVGAPISQVPPGHHGWAEPGAGPRLAPYVDLLRLGDGEAPVDDAGEAMKLVRSALEDSIRVRVDTDLTVGVNLSGGLDSALILAHVRDMHPDCVAFTVGTPDSDDVRTATRLAADLGVRHEVLELPPSAISLADVRAAVRIGELTEYGDVINAVVSNRLFAHVHRCGVKVVLSGDGSDELFGGYVMYQDVDDDVRQRLFQYNLASLSRTELQRVDRTSMGHGVEVRVPFLDLSLVRLAMRMPIDLKVRDGQEKWVLRQAFGDLLPDYVLQRRKNPMSHASGLHERIRLYRALFPRLYRSFGYEAAEPMRRDFSVLLARCGLDLDRALAEDAAQRDYTVLEHVRDLAGAARHNIRSGRRRRRPAASPTTQEARP